jgi:hypothetical protein
MFQTARLMCVFALGAAMLPAQTVPVNTVQTTPMAGIATGQTARLNLLNPGSLETAVGTPCTATVAYLDDTGTVLKTASLTVDSGKNAWLDLHSDTDLGLGVDARREIRATIATPAPPTSTTGTAAAAVCKLIPTLEIFDSVTGRTQAILGHVVTVD